MAEEKSQELEYTPTWVVAVVCFVIVLVSLLAERGLHRLGKFFRDKKQDALFEALQKLKEELMLLGFISLLLTVFQERISKICIPANISIIMLPCTLKESVTSNNLTATTGRHLLAGGGVDHCTHHKGQVPFLSLEALHDLHIFVFVLALTHVVFCVTTMVLKVAKIRSEWGHWEHSIQREPRPDHVHILHLKSFMDRSGRRWRKYIVVSWTVAFFKQFYVSVTKSEYIVLRSAFITEHCPALPKYEFHKYMMRTLEHDFKKIVRISWYLWLFVVLLLLMNIAGWNTYFWLSFLPLVSTDGFKSCIMGELGLIIPRLVIGVIVQVLCSYSTLPLYALVTQMGSRFKKGIFDQQIEGLLKFWATGGRAGSSTQNKMAMETLENICVSKRPAIEGISSTVELSYLNNHHTTP
ncbi:MLO-like protein 13 isoform X2 [Nicotiana tabacum]|uniref:MLO-like protein 13 isoform X2 n=1 Tax=Nicotiana tabacum TaxID=4097 RepID=A0AC58RLR9_TOBAC